jgi:integrase
VRAGVEGTRSPAPRPAGARLRDPLLLCLLLHTRVCCYQPKPGTGAPAREEKQPRFLTEPEYKRLLETVRFQVRNAALIEILLQTGVRLSEIARLRLQDVQLGSARW